MSREIPLEAGHFHAVKFYDSRESLSRIVSDFLGGGLAAGQPALVIATPDHRAAVLEDLHKSGHEVDSQQAVGNLLMLDAAETLATFMSDGMPDAQRFEETSTRAIEKLCRGRKDCTIRAYGEMVDVLWKNRQEAAAIRLEMLWNKLAMSHDFQLLCGYAMGNFYKDAGLAAVHNQHSHVVTEQGLTPRRRSAAVS